MALEEHVAPPPNVVPDLARDEHAVAGEDDEVDYPVSDGRPVGETDQHRDELLYYAVDVLRHHFRRSPDVYVSGNNFLYYGRGDPSAVVSPDAYVVRGVAGHQRDVFKVWEEGGHRPVFVLEITSRKTRNEDRRAKKQRYELDLQVPEYFLWDPRAEWVGEGLVGFALRDGRYVELQPLPGGRLPSAQLGLELGVEGGHLRFYEPGATTPVPTLHERAAQAERALDEAEEALATAERARDLARRRAEDEHRRAEDERRRAEDERRRADALEAELRRLRGEGD